MAAANAPITMKEALTVSAQICRFLALPIDCGLCRVVRVSAVFLVSGSVDCGVVRCGAVRCGVVCCWYLCMDRGWREGLVWWRVVDEVLMLRGSGMVQCS